jgi:uncharacterized membrane protein
MPKDDIAQKIAELKSQKFSLLDRFALTTNKRIGSFGFFILIVIWTASWLVWNILAPIEWRFDPYPAFVLWLFLSNMIQLFFLPLILIGQDLQGRQADLRAEVDFEINRRADEENREILKRLEQQQREQLLRK